MPINTDLLIAAPILQDYLVDKDGTPMAAGTITCYQDNSRTTLKNWYYQSGTPGNYTYIKLPNPLTLSAAGTICDLNGVDTIPFFYPYSELDDSVVQPYYITIVNYTQTNQITRSNFPFLPSTGVNPNAAQPFDNYIINNEFWRNIGTMVLTNILSTTVCPSQHDGFSNPDVMFMKNVGGGLDTVTFTKFPLSNTPLISGDIQPEYYLNHTCSNTPTGETQKAYYFPISLHVNTLANVEFTATIQGQNVGGTGTGQNTINLYILQYTGTGTTSPAPFLIGSISLTTGWQKYEFTSIFPSTAGLTLGSGGDDALYLIVQMPLNMNCSINFCKPSIYLSAEVPTNNFQTYDQIDTVINSPRTGDIRTSINSFYPFGWVPMNDGVLGLNAMSVVATSTLPGYTRANADTWQLFNLLWNLAQPYDSGSNSNPVCQMYTNSGTALVATNYGANAYADFNANKALALTKMFGRVLIGNVPASALFPFYAPENQAVVVSNSGGNILINPTTISGFWQGKPINFFFATGGSLPGNIVANAIYYVTNITATTFQVATTYAAALAGTPVVAYSSAGVSVGVNAHPTGSTVGQYAHTQLAGELAAHTHTLVNPLQFTFNGGNLASGSLLFPVLGSSNAGPIPFTLSGVPLTGTNANTPAGSPFNIVQPGVFYNIFMKL